MNFTFSSHDQTAVAEAARQLMSPLAHASVEGWQREVNESLKDLLQGDKASFICPAGEGRYHSVSDIGPTPVVEAYVREKLPALERRWGIRKRSVELGAINRATVYGDWLRDLYRSEYYNEYLVPLRAFDVLGMVTPHGDADQVAILYLHHDRPVGRRFGRRGLALARMLLPAFRAGLHASRTLAAHRGALVRMADAIPSGVALADGSGRILHRNAALVGMSRAEPAWNVVECELHAALLGCIATVGGVRRGIASPARSPRRVSGAAGSYLLNAVPLSGEPLGGGAQIAIVVEHVGQPPFPEQQLQTRFRLTAREVEVARLLCDGVQNAELATRLGISAFTARHHTERVMCKLGLHSRAQLAPTIARLARDAMTVVPTNGR